MEMNERERVNQPSNVKRKKILGGKGAGQVSARPSVWNYYSKAWPLHLLCGPS
jgi:hypothetical protein